MECFELEIVKLLNEGCSQLDVKEARLKVLQFL